TRQIGVDIEKVRPLVEIEGIMRRFFFESEQREFLSLPEPRRQEAFFRGWTRKEAYMKAIGMGFSMPLDKFAVTINPSGTPKLLEVAGCPEEPDRWDLRDLEPGPGYHGALAVEGSGWTLRCFRHELERIGS